MYTAYYGLDDVFSKYVHRFIWKSNDDETWSVVDAMIVLHHLEFENECWR